MKELVSDSIQRVWEKSKILPLQNYAALDNLDRYMEVVKRAEADYDVVSAAERRCFNIVAARLPHTSIVTNNALLLMYKEFARSYMECGRLPRVLICDDLAIHGRGMSKFLYQFENLIIDELASNKCLNSSDDYLRFHMQFTNAVTIYIYGKSAAPLMLHDRYLSRLHWEKVLYPGELRDLSMQLSDYLRRLNIANTAFAYSFRNTVLKDALMKRCKPKERKQISVAGGWRFFEWDYGEERMCLAVRLQGKEKVESISTIRYFPQRDIERKSIITSYSILGVIPEKTLDSVCDCCAEVLSNEKCEALASILREKPKGLRSTREQLLSTFLSILDFVDFCHAVSVKPYDTTAGYSPDDLKKIARNYSYKEQIYEELRTVAFAEDLQKKLRKSLTEELCGRMLPLLDVEISECEGTLLSYDQIEKSYEEINIIVANEVSAMGTDAEIDAALCNEGRAKFRVEDYQSIRSVIAEGYNDGMAPFALFSKRVMDEMKKHKEDDGIASCYCYIAALVALMDYGVLSMRVAATQSQEHDYITTVAKAGEMSTFHIPMKYALFIPAFAAVEENNYGRSSDMKESVLRFIERHLQNFDVNSSVLDPMPEYYRELMREKMEKLFGESSSYREDIELIYQCGQSFRGWNFENLTHQDNLMHNYLQQKLVGLAQQF